MQFSFPRSWQPTGEIICWCSAIKRLKRFTTKILCKVSPPPLPQPYVEAQPKLLTRSRRIAAQALSRVPASKRGEVLVMKRMSYLDG